MYYNNYLTPSSRRCCLCKAIRMDVVLYHFPKTALRRLKWLQCINRDNLNKLSPRQLMSRFICSKHFEKKFITPKLRLIGAAYPSLFTEDEITSGIPTQDFQNNENKEFKTEHSYSRKMHFDHTYCQDSSLKEHNVSSEFNLPGPSPEPPSCEDSDTMDMQTSENLPQTENNTPNNENIIEIEIPYNLFQYLSSEECKLQNICRICLSVNDPELCPLFSEKENCVIANMFMGICEIEMNEADGLPSSICSKCQTEVMNYYEFKMKCVKSDYILKSVLKGEFLSKEETVKHLEGLDVNRETNNVSDITNIESSPQIEVKKENLGTEIDYLEDQTESVDDNEAQFHKKNTEIKKEITNSNSEPNFLFIEVAKNKKTKSKKNSKKWKHCCAFCPKKFSKEKALQDHMSKHEVALESEYPFPCTQCQEAFNTEHDLNLHGMLHNENADWNCTVCQKKFNGRQALRRHLQRHMQWKRFSCEQCGMCFVELYALRRHARVHTGERPEKKHQCPHCDKRFLERTSLAAHLCQHGAARDCVCAACGARFPSARLLASHARVHSEDKPHECNYCGKRFRHESTRNTHHRTHTGERPFTCAQCGKTFIQKSNMTLHMRTHTGERPYTCSVCDRKFSSGSTLKTHKLTHTGEKPYSCKVCGKSFARQNLSQHMRLHSGERAHACPACHKRFATHHRLRDHYRLHTGEKPFECDMCTAKFTTKSHLIKHVKKHDKKKKINTKIMLTPVTVINKNLSSSLQSENKSAEYMLVDMNAVTNVPNINQGSLCTVLETPIQPQGLVYQDGSNMKTEVIVLENPNLVTSGTTYTNDVNLVTVNEGEVSISTASTTGEGTMVKLYQYDQSLLQIQTGGGHLTISRISSKMTANF